MKQKPPAVWEAFSVGRNARHDGFPWGKAIMRHACMRALQAECGAVIDRKRTIIRRKRILAFRCESNMLPPVRQTVLHNPSVTADAVPPSRLPARSALLPSAKVSSGHPRPCRGGKNPSGLPCLPCGNPPPLAGEASGAFADKKPSGSPGERSAWFFMDYNSFLNSSNAWGLAKATSLPCDRQGSLPS